MKDFDTNNKSCTSNDTGLLKKKSLYLSINSLLLFFILYSCDQPFNLIDSLDNAESVITSGQEQTLSISPKTIGLYIGSSILFTTTGGEAPYSYSVISGSGTIVSGVYTAPGIAGTAIIEVSDVNGNTDTADIIIADTLTNVDYSVSEINDTSATTTGGEPLSGTFTLTNIDASDGTRIINWDVFLSDNTTYSSDDDLQDTGSTGQLTAGASVVIGFNGIWPVTAGTYYYIIRTYSLDDILNVANNEGSSPAITVSAPDIDYIVTGGSISTTGSPAGGGSLINESFTITNAGPNNGNEIINWTAYYSTDNVFDNPGDTLIDSGQTGALDSTATSSAINIDNGSWPTVSTDTPYYLFVDIASSDELPANTGNNNESSLFTITAADIDYEILTISNTITPADTSTAINETFTFANKGSDNGNSDVMWNAYRSTDAVYDSGDQIISAGQESALISGATSTAINITGNWSSEAGNYYLIVTITSADETSISNNVGVSSSFEINSVTAEPDYIISSISCDYPTVITGSVINEEFDLRNSSATGGAAPVTWNAYASDDTSFGGDIFLGTGTTAAVTAGNTVTESITASWTGTAGTYYLLLEVSSADETIETGNNVFYSGPFSVNNPTDYSVIFDNTVRVTGITDNGISGSPTFTINNELSYDGNTPISWQVYYSKDRILSGDDVEMDSGVEAALPGSNYSQPAFSGNWPTSADFYFLIVTITASDDNNTTNNHAVSPPIAVAQQVFVEVESNDALGNGGGNGWDGNSLTGFVINSGDSIAIRATMDAYDSYDIFGFQTGPGITTASDLIFQVQWDTVYDDIDFELYNSSDGTSTIYDSIDSSPYSEPSTVSPIQNFSGNTLYYMAIYFYLGFDSSGSTGEEYSILISAP